MAEYPVQDLEGVPMSDVMQITLLQAHVARLEGELAERAQVYDDHIIAEKTRNAALAAALRPFVALLEQYITRSDYFEDNTVVYAINDAQITVSDLFAARDAALSDTGEGKQPWHRSVAISQVEMQRQNLSYAAQYGALWRGKAEAAEARLLRHHFQLLHCPLCFPTAAQQEGE